MAKSIPTATKPAAAGGPFTLSIDIGGTHLKCGVLDSEGALADGPQRADTPHPAPPAQVMDVVAGMASRLRAYDRVSIGFPGFVRGGRVLTAPNLSTEDWANYPLTEAAQKRFGKPVRLLNDATVQGLGVIAGKGTECVLTLGTGFGFALFEDGRLSAHLEVGQHIVWKKMTYDQYVGDAAYKDVGAQRWNKRMQRVIYQVDTLVMYDALYIGGGNARHVAFALPDRVRLVSNDAGITGGVKLWGAALDRDFASDAGPAAAAIKAS